MRRTNRLGLPIFDNPNTDKFGLDEWNYANETIDEAYDEIDNIRKEIPKVNASAEVIEARKGNATLGKRIDSIDNDLKNATSQLEQKASKNEIGSPLIASSINNMTDRTKVYVNTTDGKWYSWNGTSWVVGGTYNSQGIGNKAITPEKTSFIDISPNLFDKNNCINGMQLVGAGSDINTMQSANEFTWVSNIIEVDANAQYISNSKSDASRFMVVSFKSDGSYDAGITATLSGENYVFTTRANTKFLRFTFATTVFNMETFMLAKGTELPTTYKPYYKKIDENLISDVIKRISVIEESTNIAENPCKIFGEEITTFNKIVCCGDSLTRGVFNSSTTGFENNNYSYPTYLTKLTGVVTENLGNPSYTTKQWYENRQGRDFSTYDCAIIQLGVNDVVQNVGDAETLEYLQKIIDKLKSDQPKIKIFIATITKSKWYDTEAYKLKSEVIRQFASGKENQNIFCIDLKKYSQSYELPYASGHLTALGYMKQAEEYRNYISYIMRNNGQYFGDIQFIGTDYLPYS